MVMLQHQYIAENIGGWIIVSLIGDIRNMRVEESIDNKNRREYEYMIIKYWIMRKKEKGKKRKRLLRKQRKEKKRKKERSNNNIQARKQRERRNLE